MRMPIPTLIKTETFLGHMRSKKSKVPRSVEHEDGGDSESMVRGVGREGAGKGAG